MGREGEEAGMGGEGREGGVRGDRGGGRSGGRRKRKKERRGEGWEGRVVEGKPVADQKQCSMTTEQ